MRNLMKTTLASLLSLSLLPTAASAYTVGAPFPGTVTAATYYSSGSFHGAIDLASGSGCGYWGVETAVQASLAWTVNIRTTARVCNGNGSGNQNEVRHTFSNGYTFRQWHFLYVSTTSKSRTCDRCQVGDEGGTGNASGPHTHMQYDKSGTNNTAWYSGTTKGKYLARDQKVGTVG